MPPKSEGLVQQTKPYDKDTAKSCDGEKPHIFNGTVQDDKMKGTQCDDYMYGYEGSDIIYSYAGDDYIVNGKGSDEIHGGEGYDILDFSNYTNNSGSISMQTQVWVNTGFIRIIDHDGLISGGSNQFEVIDDLFNISGTQTSVNSYFGIEEIIGTDLNDVIISNISLNNVETIRGGEGDDYLLGRYLQDAIYGGEGDDIFNLTGASKNTVYGGEGNDIFRFTGLYEPFEGENDFNKIMDFEHGNDYFILDENVYGSYSDLEIYRENGSTFITTSFESGNEFIAP